MTQAWPVRLTHAATIDVNAGVPSVLSSLGGVLGVTDNGVGDYSINLKGPGIPGFAAHAPVPVAVGNGNNFIGISVRFVSATEVRVTTWDAAGVAADASFSLAIFTTERTGVAT